MRHDWRLDKIAIEDYDVILGVDWDVSALCTRRVQMEGNVFCGLGEDIWGLGEKVEEENYPYLD
jgi:hypothetical protein